VAETIDHDRVGGRNEADFCGFERLTGSFSKSKSGQGQNQAAKIRAAVLRLQFAS